MLLFQEQLEVDPETIVPALVDAGVTIAVFVVAFVLVYGIGKRLAAGAVRRGLEHRGYEPTIVGLAVTVTVVVTLVLSVSVAATVAGFGVVLTAFAALAGAIAIAVGFATRDLLSNFVAGVFILQDKPFTVGDWIEWDGNTGIVREIHLRVTKLETLDNELVTVPNGELAGTAVTNYDATDRLRVRYDFGIGYDDDIDHAREAILEEAAEIDHVLDEPAPAAPVVDLGGSAVVLSGRVWIDPREKRAPGVRMALVERVKKRFDAEGIDMPYHNTELSGAVTVEGVEGVSPAAE